MIIRGSGGSSVLQFYMIMQLGITLSINYVRIIEFLSWKGASQRILQYPMSMGFQMPIS